MYFRTVRVKMIQQLRSYMIGIFLVVGLHTTGYTQYKIPPRPEIAPDMILHNAEILTMEPRQRVQQAIAIYQDKVLAVGRNAEILAMQDRYTRVIDIQGHTIMPGFVDAHTHLFNDFTDAIPDLETAQAVAIKNGITTLGNLFAIEDTVRQLRAFEPNLKIRTSLYLQKTTNCGVVVDDWYLDYPPTREPGERLRINGIKLFTDGGTCGAPAISVERVPGTGLGDLFHAQEQLNRMVKEAHEAGYQVAIHSIGDRGIMQALKAIEFVLEGSANALRHRVEHNGVLTPEIITKYGEIGAVATVFGYKRTCRLPSELPVFYQQSENAHRTLIEQTPGLVVAWHGDDPWVEPINPLIDLFSLTTRIDVISDGGPCYPPQWLADEAVTVEQALKMMTINAAYALDRDQEVGSLKPGKFADLIVLSANPLKVDLQMLKDIEVKATMIGGDVLFSRLSLAPNL